MSDPVKIPYSDIFAIIAGAFISKQMNLSLLPTIGVSLAVSVGVAHVMHLDTSYTHDLAMKVLKIDMPNMNDSEREC